MLNKQKFYRHPNRNGHSLKLKTLNGAKRTSEKNKIDLENK